MGHPKGTRNRYYSKEFKVAIAQKALSGHSAVEVAREGGINRSQVRAWIRIYSEKGETGLENKKRPGNPLAKYSNRKELTEVERLRYELAKAEIEIAKLKKAQGAGRRNA